MSRCVWLALLCGVLVAQVQAAEQLNVTANGPAQVSLDGQPVGPAPATIPNIPPGFHQLQVQSETTGEVYIYDLYSPATASLVKDVPVQFQGVAAAPVAAAVPAPPPGNTAVVVPEGESREKRRVRNTLLGAAVANEFLNRGRSKKGLRGLTLGGALVNELLNR